MNILPRLHLDPCPDAQGFATLRPFDGSKHGDTDAQPIATVYNATHAAEIARRCNEFDALIKAAREVVAELDHDTLGAGTSARVLKLDRLISRLAPAPDLASHLFDLGCAMNRAQAAQIRA